MDSPEMDHHEHFSKRLELKREEAIEGREKARLIRELAAWRTIKADAARAERAYQDRMEAARSQSRAKVTTAAYMEARMASIQQDIALRRNRNVKQIERAEDFREKTRLQECRAHHRISRAQLKAARKRTALEKSYAMHDVLVAKKAAEAKNAALNAKREAAIMAKEKEWQQAEHLRWYKLNQHLVIARAAVYLLPWIIRKQRMIRRRSAQRRQAAMRILVFVRRYLGRLRQRKATERAALVIQRWWRRELRFCVVWRLLRLPYNQHRMRRCRCVVAATTIQRIYRGYRTRDYLWQTSQRTVHAAIFLQKVIKGFLIRRQKTRHLVAIANDLPCPCRSSIPLKLCVFCLGDPGDPVLPMPPSAPPVSSSPRGARGRMRGSASGQGNEQLSKSLPRRSSGASPAGAPPGGERGSTRLASTLLPGGRSAQRPQSAFLDMPHRRISRT
eukprot:jgi/Mesvir1/13529/Mv16411-RA.1